MKEGTGAVKSTLFEKDRLTGLPPQELSERMKNVIREELSELQRYTVLAYYFEKKNLEQIAQERNVNKSTVSRTLRRAEKNLRKFLQY